MESAFQTAKSIKIDETAQRNIIIYFGCIQFEYNNAMCQQAIGRKKLIEGIGYRPIIIGVSPNVKRGEHKKFNEYSYMINNPQTITDRIKEYVSTADIEHILCEIGNNSIYAIIMADFRYFPIKKMKSYCENNGIKFVIEINDWLMANKSLLSIVKKIDCDMRMYKLYPKVDRRIYICSSYNFAIGKGIHTAVIPGVIFEKNTTIDNKSHDEMIHLAFLGLPGLMCEKEKIDWVIKGIAERNLFKRFKVHLAGFDKNEFLENNAYLMPYITENIIFYGRITHYDCIKLLFKSDFSLVVRPKNIRSQYGFSTKIGEAFSCGTPVLATDTSDNKVYIKNGCNGFVCGCSYNEVKDLLSKVSRMTREEIEQMKKNVSCNNPLYYTNFLQSFAKVLG